MKAFDPGKYIKQGYYKSLQPSFINRDWQLEDMEVINLLSQADRQLGRLDMYSEYIPNIELSKIGTKRNAMNLVRYLHHTAFSNRPN